MSGVYFAYDGSIHGDWVSHYAARLATAHPQRTLHLVHVAAGRETNSALHEKVDRIGVECRRLGATLQQHVTPMIGTVAQTLVSTIPAGAFTYLVCGTRGRDRKRGLVSGSISEQLLRLGHCHVLAIRVVQPGLLGLPRHLLLPVSGHPRGFRAGLPFLKLLAQDAARLHVLHVERVSRWRFRMLSHESADQLRSAGQSYCGRIQQEIRGELGLGAEVVDSQAVVSDDVPKEIVIAANKTKSRLIYLGASERNLTERFFFGNPIEQVLRDTTCDVAIYRGLG